MMLLRPAAARTWPRPVVWDLFMIWNTVRNASRNVCPIWCVWLLASHQRKAYGRWRSPITVALGGPDAGRASRLYACAGVSCEEVRIVDAAWVPVSVMHLWVSRNVGSRSPLRTCRDMTHRYDTGRRSDSRAGCTETRRLRQESRGMRAPGGPVVQVTCLRGARDLREADRPANAAASICRVGGRADGQDIAMAGLTARLDPGLDLLAVVEAKPRLDALDVGRDSCRRKCKAARD